MFLYNMQRAGCEVGSLFFLEKHCGNNNCKSTTFIANMFHTRNIDMN